MCRWRVRARLRVGYIIIVIITRLPDRPADTLRIFPAVFSPNAAPTGNDWAPATDPLWPAPPLVLQYQWVKYLIWERTQPTTALHEYRYQEGVIPSCTCMPISKSNGP